jgi:cytochrome b
MQERDTAAKRLIWDLPTRVFHWALAGSFLGAYLFAEQDELRSLHVMFGYTVAGLIAFRMLWGLIGSTHSRFRDFAYSPVEAIRYLRDLTAGRARDYDGHNPAGSWAIYGLLTIAAATAATGWLQYNEIGGDALEELHELLANAWLVLVAVHVAGVIVGSLAHRRNLVATMITGQRTAEGGVSSGEVRATCVPERGHTDARPRWALGSALAATVLAFWTWAVTTGGSPLPSSAGDTRGEREYGKHVQHRSGFVQAGEHDDEDDD